MGFLNPGELVCRSIWASYLVTWRWHKAPGWVCRRGLPGVAQPSWTARNLLRGVGVGESADIGFCSRSSRNIGYRVFHKFSLVNL